MPTFTVEEFKEFKCLNNVSKLFRDGKCLVKQFIDETRLDANLKNEIGDLYAVLEDIANNKMHPKCKKLNLSPKLKYKPFEIKSFNLRLYIFHDTDLGKIIVFGGKKTNQTKDLKRFEKLIKEYMTDKPSNKSNA